MEDPKWLRLITIGLVLAALAVGYFLLSGRLASNSTRNISQINQATSTPTQTAAASPSVLGINGQATPTPTPTSAYNRIASRNQGQSQATQALPNTGFPLGLTIVFSVAVMISGWGLRKFPY